MLATKIRGFFALLLFFCFIPSASEASGWTAYAAGDIGIEDYIPALVRINTDSKIAAPPINLGIPNFYQYGIAITPNGQTAYVCLANDDAISKLVPIALPSGEVQESINLIGMVKNIAITPDGNWAYVTNDLNTVIQINLNTKTVTNSITLENSTKAIAITPDGKRAYIGSDFGYTVTVLKIENPESLEALLTLDTIYYPQNIAITPDGSRVYVTNLIGTVTRIDNGNIPSIGNTISLDTFPDFLVITPNGTTAYVLSSFFADTPVIIQINLSTEVVEDTITLPFAFNPSGIAITPDSATAFITGYSDQMVLAMTLSNKELQVINDIPYPKGIIITPDQAPTARFTTTAAEARSISTFDASLSSSPIGTIAFYEWDFGDGNTFSTQLPTTTHTYNKHGKYIVSLTVTNSGDTSLDQTFTGQSISNNGAPSAQKKHKIHIAPTTRLEKPSDFNGKIENSSRKHHFALKTKWNPSHSKDTLHYEIFIHHTH